VTDAHEPSGQYVQKEAPQELCGCECHLFLLTAVGIILPAGKSRVLGQRPTSDDWKWPRDTVVSTVALSVMDGSDLQIAAISRSTGSVR
jgi:hypothetical protein